MFVGSFLLLADVLVEKVWSRGVIHYNFDTMSKDVRYSL